MDNMRVHHSKVAMEAYQAHSITPIFNIPYCPQFNGIESVFSMIKQFYKQAALKRIVRDQPYSSLKLIDKSIGAADLNKVRNCIQDGLN